VLRGFATGSTTMTSGALPRSASLARTRGASAAGVVLALAFPFLPYEVRVPDFLNLSGEVASEVGSIAVKLIVAVSLAVIGFAIRKRSLQFYQIRSPGRQDVIAMVLAIAAQIVLVVLVSIPLHPHAPALPSDTAESELPLALGLVSSVAAGISEEFIWRAFVIEELGELIRSRYMAGGISLAFFALAHHSSYLGWSVGLVFPALGGLVTTVLYFWRRNLPICMLQHTAIDFLAMMLQHM